MNELRLVCFKNKLFSFLSWLLRTSSRLHSLYSLAFNSLTLAHMARINTNILLQVTVWNRKDSTLLNLTFKRLCINSSFICALDFVVLIVKVTSYLLLKLKTSSNLILTLQVKLYFWVNKMVSPSFSTKWVCYLMNNLIINFSLLSHRPCSSLHKFCQLDILCRQPSTVVGWQGYLDSAVHIKPFRMMIHFFRHESHASHKTKSLVEILEFELLVNSITSFNFCPARFHQGLKFGFFLFSCKFGGFWWSL